MMKACVFVYACDMMLVVEAGTTHHLSVHPCEQRPAVPSVLLSTTHTQKKSKKKKKGENKLIQFGLKAFAHQVYFFI